jgi:hypothetical protein
MCKKVVLFSLLTATLLLSLFSPPARVNAAGTCSCVTYIKNYFGITDATGDGYATGTWFANHGFTKLSTPQVGTVVVMQRNFPGASTASGHVAIITRVEDQGTKWKIWTKGGGQYSGTALTEFDCNIRDTSWSAYVKSNTAIAYYKQPNYAVRSAMPGSTKLYFDINGGSTNSGANVIGWTYHGGNNQIFTFIKYGSVYKIIARNSAMCIVPEGTGQGAKLVQKKCTGATDLEKWYVTSTNTGYMLKNYKTGYVVDLAGGSLNPGTWMLNWSSHNGSNQRWLLDGR